MAKLFQEIRIGTLTDAAVRAKTGKTWEEWCKTLDKAGARMMEHAEIALLLQKQMGLSRWWGQMVAVGYEKERGMRQGEGGEPAGKRYEVTLTKIVAAPRAAVWAAWQDPGTLTRWLPDAKFEVSKTEPHKILHLDWSDETRVAVRFYERRGKTTVVVSHRGLAESDAACLQEYWDAALDRLKAIVAR
jgi:uncharacterized protein YndB with AHSA1/START domain